jgi:hypothetical protein
MSEVFPVTPIQNVPSVHFGKNDKGKPFIYLNSAFVRIAKKNGVTQVEAVVDSETGRSIINPNEETGRVLEVGTRSDGEDICANIVQSIGEPQSDYMLDWDTENRYYYCTIKEPEETDGNAD